MPRVRYLGWTDRESRSGIVKRTSRLKKSLHVGGERLVLRGYPGRPTPWREVSADVADALRDEDDFEVKS